jgi:hypothetical protein
MIFKTSPTDIEDADTSTREGCPRRWRYKRIAKQSGVVVESAGDDARAWGEEGHAQIQRYLQGGDRPDRADVVQHLDLLPPPPLGDLRVEQYQQCTLGDGVLCTTKQDLVHARPTSIAQRAGVLDLEDVPGRVEVVDWKFPGSNRFVPTDEQLRDKIQPALYAFDWHQRGVEWVRVSIVSFVKKPRTLEIATDLLQLRDVEHTVSHAYDVALKMAAWAELDVEEVPGNRDACGAFGGCPWRRDCSVARWDPLRQILGDEAARRVIMAATATTPSKDTTTMGFMDKINKARTTAEQGGETAEQRAARERLEAIPAELRDALQIVQDAAPRYGRPQLSGRAAQMWAAFTGAKISPQAGLAGSGQLGDNSIEDPSVFIELAAEIYQHDNPPKTAHPSSPRPADAPESNPAAHVENAEAAKAKRKDKLAKSRETKPADGPAVDAAVAAHDAAEQPAPRRIIGGEILVLVDCMPVDDVAQARLEPYCYEVLAAAGDAADMQGLDIRLSSGEKMGFGRWRTAVELMVAASPPAPGVWLLDSRGGELAEAVIAGLLSSGKVRVIRGYR